MSLFKYYKDKYDADGERLWWPGKDGIPFRGPLPPPIKQEEYDNLQMSGKARCRLFFLAKEEDLNEYIRVRDRCANGLYIPIDRDRVWDEETRNYRIFLEWIELGYDAAPTEGNYDAIADYTKNATPLTPYSRLAGVNNQGW